MKKLLIVLGMVLIPAGGVLGQDEGIITRLFEDAIEVLGGQTYLKVQDMVSTGNYFVFDREGASSPIIKFTDYTKFPDKSRFELGNRKKELEVTVFNLEKGEGWILEGQKEPRAATAEEMRNFRVEVKRSIETIFRFRYRDPANKLFYLGPGEGRDATLELVKLVDPENDEVVIYFDRISKLPAKIEYWSLDNRGIRQRVIQEFSQWHRIQGVNTPLRIDGYVNNRRAFQFFILKITYNNNLPDNLFAKPVPPK